MEGGGVSNRDVEACGWLGGAAWGGGGGEKNTHQSDATIISIAGDGERKTQCRRDNHSALMSAECY